jgi:hypothetical protein
MVDEPLDLNSMTRFLGYLPNVDFIRVQFSIYFLKIQKLKFYRKLKASLLLPFILNYFLNF